jgi:MarR family transcriptional regulator, transcriptional regulator for hemolysin
MSKDKWQGSTAPLGIYFSLLTKYFTAAMVKKMSPIGLDKYFSVLVAVEQSRETITQQKLSEYFKTSKVSMVRIIDYLAEKDYLQRRVNTKDRREHLLILTDKAKRELPYIKQILLEIEAGALHNFTEEQKIQFFQYLEKIYYNVSKFPAEAIVVEHKQVEKKPKHPAKVLVENLLEG